MMVFVRFFKKWLLALTGAPSGRTGFHDLGNSHQVRGNNLPFGGQPSAPRSRALLKSGGKL